MFFSRHVYRVAQTLAKPQNRSVWSAMASTAENVGPVDINGAPKRKFEGKQGFRFKNKNKKQKSGAPEGLKSTGDHDEVLIKDIESLIQRLNLRPTTTCNDTNGATHGNATDLPELRSDLSLEVKEISSTGDGLAVQEGSSQIYVVPFTAPGDRVKARVFRHTREGYSTADLLEVESPSEHRDNSLVKCPYFATCSGCQFQMLPYEWQLKHKKTIVEKAYQNFSNLSPSKVPPVGDTIGSPLQYGYRTKLTPHFDGPPDARRSDGRRGRERKFESVPNIGFMKKGTKHTIDIEDCPIGTDAVRLGMKRERARVASEISSYKRGATLLLRESTERISRADIATNPSLADPSDPNSIIEDFESHIHKKTCVTDQKATTTEYINDYVFSNPAGAFFQNNNSILPTFTKYIRTHILPPPPSTKSPTTSSTPPLPITHLVDAYSGSGLFTITLSSLFTRSIGIDISPSSIQSASLNATLNSLPLSSTKFLAADAATLFSSVTDFPKDQTVVMIDPPRKGCDASFLKQLLEFGPMRVVYVSCNVHTQARDVGVLVDGLEGRDGVVEVEGGYEIESLRGFDFFPQTGHVEGVVVLRRKEKIAASGSEVDGGLVEESTSNDDQA